MLKAEKAEKAEKVEKVARADQLKLAPGYPRGVTIFPALA